MKRPNLLSLCSILCGYASTIAHAGTVAYAGINIAGFDFGCKPNGTCFRASMSDPGQDGIDQMIHFGSKDRLNVFRMPVAWQYLVKDRLGGKLDEANFGEYDKLVQGCLYAGAKMCIIDIHNYARWNGLIIGQSSVVTNDHFAGLWGQLARKYAGETRVAFGLMNEPHILDISTWAGSVQAAVTAIRAAGASTNKILMPGTGFAAAGSFIDTGSGVALLGVVDHDNSTDNLIFDVHQYLDDNFSGTNAECARGNVEAFERLGEWLRNYKRQAMLTETGGGAETDSCLKNFCKQLATLNEYSDVYLGWVGWSAGSFSADKEEYVLTERPKGAKGHFEDQRLVSECIVGQFIL